MKIFYLSLHPHIGFDDISGPGMHIREIINGLRQAGNEVIWVSPHRGNPSAPWMNKSGSFSGGLKGVIKRIIPAIIWETLSDIRLIIIDRSFEKELQRLIDQQKPDLIYERAYYMMGAGHRISRRNGIKYFVEMNSPYTLEKPEMSHPSGLGWLAEQNEKRQLLTMTYGFVVTSSLKEYFVAKYPKAKDKLIVTPNAVRRQHMLADDMPPNHGLRDSLGLKSEDILITFVGSIFPYHGVDILIKAFALARKENTSVKLKLLIIGDGAILMELKELSRELGLTNEVCFLGKIPNDQAREYLAVSQIAVQANCTWYNSPLKLFEYGSQRVAIIAPACPGVLDVMTDGQDGLIITPDVTRIAEALVYLSENPEMREKYARNFYERVRTMYTWENIAKKIISLAR